MTPAFHGKVLQGKIKLDKPDEFKLWIGSVEGKEIVLGVEERKRFSKRSLKQNNFYWAYLNLISKEVGTYPEELHEFFKRKFLQPKTRSILGEEMKYPGSTRILDKIQFTEYMDKIQDKTGVPIPNPEDVFSY